jgi:hypothetical protein
MHIIYNKADGLVKLTSATNSIFPNGLPDISLDMKNVIDLHGRTESDYDVLRLHDFEDAEVVAKTFTHEYTVQNGEIVFGELKSIPEPEPQPPTEIELLQKKVEAQEQVIEELMFIIIPELSGGGI